MPTNFLEATGTNGYIASVLNLLTTELNSLASGGAATSSVGGSSGVFSQSNTGSAIWADMWFKFGGSNTPAAGGYLLVWYLRSTDGGTTFETVVATPSTTVFALPRAADAVVPLSNAAYASGNLAWAQGSPRLWWPSTKIVLQNLSGGALPASGNILTVGPAAIQY